MPLSWMNVTAERRNAKWFTNGLLTNPTSGTVLASTGPVVEHAEYHLYIVGSSTAAAQVSIVHRDSAGNAVGGPIHLPIGANMPVELFIPVRLGKGHYVDVVNATVLVGSIAFSIVLVEAYQAGAPAEA